MRRRALGQWGCIRRRVVVCAVGVAAAMGLGAGTAQAGVFWAHFGGVTSQQGIGRALNDGSHVTEPYLATPNDFVRALAVDSKYIYYLTGESYNIARANIDGTGANPNFIVNTDPPNAVAVDSHYIYWGNGRYIGRANLDGTSPNPKWVDLYLNWHFLQPSCYRKAISLAVSANYLYFAGNGDCDYFTVGRVGLDGSNLNYYLYQSHTHPVQAVAVDSQHLYWLQYFGWTNDSYGQYTHDTGYVVRANLDGSSPAPDLNNTPTTTRFMAYEVAAPFEFPELGHLIEHGTWPSGLAVDSTGIYWASDYGVGHANLDGTNQDDHFINLSKNGGLKPTAVAATPACPTTSSTANGTQTAYFAETYQPSATGYTTACAVSEHKASVIQPTNIFVDGQVNALRLQKKGSDGSFYTVASNVTTGFGNPAPVDYVGGPGTYRWQVEAGYVAKYPGPYSLSLVTPSR